MFQTLGHGLSVLKRVLQKHLQILFEFLTYTKFGADCFREGGGGAVGEREVFGSRGPARGRNKCSCFKCFVLICSFFVVCF